MTRQQHLAQCSDAGPFWQYQGFLALFRDLTKRGKITYAYVHGDIIACGFAVCGHSAATILMAAGMHPKMVQERMGHSTIAMTMDIYSHMLPSMQQEVAEKIDDMFKRS
ncbi:MAG TPA: tyrosine-type recombinase/integrase [Ktedonobacteraceae bacterium]|nr:tyrosine-type recombinase/integrase [Ktedonobacteraceae bacterium]